MESREFKKITRECLNAYGFEYFDKCFYLNLNHIVIHLQYSSYRQRYVCEKNVDTVGGVSTGNL